MIRENDGAQNFIPSPAVFYGRNAASFCQARRPLRPDRSTAWNENATFKNEGGPVVLNGGFPENPCSIIKILVYFVGGLRGEYEPEIC
jgi:hypothetical protein